MAQRTHVTMIDDIDGSEGAETTAFAFGGVAYEIDLTEENFAKFSELVSPYVEAARRVGGRKRGSRGQSNKSTGTSDAAAIREWGRENGYKVNERGRVSAELRAAYEARDDA